MSANVNQFLETTIVDNGSTADIVGYSVGITSTQFYSVLFAITTILLFVLTFIYLLIKTYVNKSCAGCKRLKKCENEIKEIKQKIETGNYLDFDVFQNISDKLDDIKEDLQNG